MLLYGQRHLGDFWMTLFILSTRYSCGFSLLEPSPCHAGLVLVEHIVDSGVPGIWALGEGDSLPASVPRRRLVCAYVCVCFF